MSTFVHHIKNGISYRIGGTGPVLVLLRGLARWSPHWCGFDIRLATTHTVITIDNRGFGKSKDAPLRWSASVADFAHDVLTVLDAASVEKTHILGVSLGGMIAMSLGSMAPSRIQSITLVNASVAGSPYRRITPQAILALSGAVYKTKTVHDDLAEVLLGPNASPDLRHQFAETWRTIDVVEGVSITNIVKQLLAARRFRANREVRAITAPVHIIKCLGDKFVDPRCSDWIHTLIPTATIVEHPSAGHELAFEDPPWFCREIESFTSKFLV